MDFKAIYGEACQRMASPLMIEGFMPKHETLLWSKTSEDGDMVYEVFFEPKYDEKVETLGCVPHVFILSNKVLKWQKEELKLSEANGMVWGGQLGNIAGYDEYKIWNLSETDIDESIDEIIKVLADTMIPAFHSFEGDKKIIDHFSHKGGIIGECMDISMLAVSYMLLNANKSETRSYMQNTIQHSPVKGQVMDLCHILPRMKHIDPNQTEFFSANNVKIAYLNGIEL